MEGEHPSASFVESEDIIWMEQCDMSTGGSTGIFLDLGLQGSRESGEFVLCCFERDRDHLINASQVATVWRSHTCWSNVMPHIAENIGLLG